MWTVFQGIGFFFEISVGGIENESYKFWFLLKMAYIISSFDEITKKKIERVAKRKDDRLVIRGLFGIF